MAPPLSPQLFALLHACWQETVSTALRLASRVLAGDGVHSSSPCFTRAGKRRCPQLFALLHAQETVSTALRLASRVLAGDGVHSSSPCFTRAGGRRCPQLFALLHACWRETVSTALRLASRVLAGDGVQSGPRSSAHPRCGGAGGPLTPRVAFRLTPDHRAAPGTESKKQSRLASHTLSWLP